MIDVCNYTTADIPYMLLDIVGTFLAIVINYFNLLGIIGLMYGAYRFGKYTVNKVNK